MYLLWYPDQKSLFIFFFLGRTGRASQLPLIRLNVKYRDERQVFNAIRFGQSYIGKVANPEDMIKCNPLRETVRKKGANDTIKTIVSLFFLRNPWFEKLTTDWVEKIVVKSICSQNLKTSIGRHL